MFQVKLKMHKAGVRASVGIILIKHDFLVFSL